MPPSVQPRCLGMAWVVSSRNAGGGRWLWPWAWKCESSVYWASLQASCTLGGLSGCPGGAQVRLGATALVTKGGSALWTACQRGRGKVWLESIQPGAWPGLAWPHKEGSSPCCRGMPWAQRAKRRRIGFQRRRGCQGERQDAALFSLAQPGKWDVASGVRRGAGASRPGCAMGSGCLF